MGFALAGGGMSVCNVYCDPAVAHEKAIASASVSRAASFSTQASTGAAVGQSTVPVSWMDGWANAGGATLDTRLQGRTKGGGGDTPGCGGVLFGKVACRCTWSAR